MSEAIGVVGVTKSYGKAENIFTALSDVSFTVNQGESLAIVGKSGSGKSTLMHLLALMDKPTSGTLRINGQDAGKLATKKLNQLRNVTFGFVFQQFFLNGNASVLENVILPLKIAGIASGERKRRGLAALEAVELKEKASSQANDLSGGQKQRAVIARALINNPSIIFADEPTGNLDTITGRKVEDILFSLNKKQGITLIIVTHDHELASRAGRQLVMVDGHLQDTKTHRRVQL